MRKVRKQLLYKWILMKLGRRILKSQTLQTKILSINDILLQLPARIVHEACCCPQTLPDRLNIWCSSVRRHLATGLGTPAIG
mmetsp:Transcript_3689/g.6613  ORF Transcript_3689/g.6613 Transcript_3689/m.6613 type:complete len:82 (+) Transcript_3689:448-693(+)